MSKHQALIPLGTIERIRLYINSGRLSLSEIVEREAPDFAITGNFYGPDWRPVCPIKADGEVLENDMEWAYAGLCWDRGPDASVDIIPSGGNPAYRSYIANCCGIYHGQDQKMVYGADAGGRRGRTAWGMRDGALALLAFPDGRDGMTPEEARDYAKAQGWSDFILGDGGRKVNYYDRASGTLIQGKDPSQNLILIYLKKKEGTPVDKFTVCLDPGHGPETVNASPDGTYRESEFAWDMYGRISALLEERGINTVCTRTEDTKPSLTERCAVSNSAGADCFVSIHTNAFGSGWTSASGLELYTSSGPDTARRNVLAAKLAERFRGAGVKLRQNPVKHSMDMTVLTKTTSPAVLIEYGYHTNEEDVVLLKDSAYRDKLARATARGVCDFLGVEWPEADEPDEWASEEWEAAKKAGIMDGTRPHDPLTRQEAAVILYRAGII